MTSNPQTRDLRENLRLRSDLVFSVPGSVLRLSFYVRFARRDAARVTLSANGQVVRVLRAVDYAPGGDTIPTMTAIARRGAGKEGGREGEEEDGWNLIAFDYTTPDRLLQLSFSYALETAEENTIWLDQVSIFPSGITHPPTPLSSSPPPATTFARAVRGSVIKR
ncbi:hypothetical protein GGR51DRAFT_572280 [Nemania sp. FL0031]|nr:hypothetical protein GGR51DRAFT_572280 [Nemania sp. FL0031]